MTIQFSRSGVGFYPGVGRMYIPKKGFSNLEHFGGLVFRDTQKHPTVTRVEKGTVIHSWHIRVIVTSRWDKETLRSMKALLFSLKKKKPKWQRGPSFFLLPRAAEERVITQGWRNHQRVFPFPSLLRWKIIAFSRKSWSNTCLIQNQPSWMGAWCQRPSPTSNVAVLK